MDRFDLIALLLATLGALSASVLFLMGLWRTVRTYKEKIRAVFRRFFAPKHPLALGRAILNPVLRGSSHAWEAAAVMNPAAILEGNRVHLFYRAIGTDGASRVGYASSGDGAHFDKRLPYPVFSLGDADPAREALVRRHNPTLYAMLMASGGSWSGCEDPRAVVIEDRIYLSFSAFAGWNSLRIGVVSIRKEDFDARRWLWSKPIFLSAPNEVHKNWVLFPRKINGTFAVLHGFSREDRNRAHIAYLDTLLEEPRPYIKSDARFRDAPASAAWDTYVRGAGPPPIETSRGWLLLYHAIDRKDPHRYKLGAMLLDASDPARVIKRSPLPVLEPDAWYENEGAKSGVIYACGAVVKEGFLIVYYGGADSVVCAAATPFDAFVERLASGKDATLS